MDIICAATNLYAPATRICLPLVLVQPVLVRLQLIHTYMEPGRGSIFMPHAEGRARWAHMYICSVIPGFGARDVVMHTAVEELCCITVFAIMLLLVQYRENPQHEITF